MDSLENKNSNSSTSSDLMDKISKTINSLMPNSKSNTNNNLESINKSQTSNITDPVYTKTTPYSASPNQLEKDLNNTTSNNENKFPSFMDIFKNLYFKIFLLLLILAFLGFNLFRYLANATDKTSEIFADPFKNIIAFFAELTGQSSKNIISTSADGSKVGIDVAAGAVNDAIDLGERSVGVNPNQSLNENNKDDSDNESTSSLKKAIKKRRPSKTTTLPEPDDAGSTTQASKPHSKGGYCFIGEDRGFRSCIKVNEGDTCMSGDIFPSKDICINPNLRQ